MHDPCRLAGAVEESETKLLGAADFPDTPTNRRSRSNRDQGTQPCLGLAPCTSHPVTSHLPPLTSSDLTCSRRSPTSHDRLIDAVAESNGWAPYRSLIVYLAYHLQEADEVLI